MDCQTCGTLLPSNAKACPQCGTRTPAYYADSNASPYGPTTPAASELSTLAMNESAPASQYGSNPYGMPPPPPSYNSNPYEASLPSPSYSSDPYSTPASYRRSSGGRIVLIAVVLILLIVGSGGIYYGTVYQPNQLHAQATVQAQNAAAAATSTVQARIALGQQNATALANSTATAQAEVTATATSFQNLFLTGTDAIPTLVEPLSDNSKGLQWDEGQGCVFKGGAYHAINASSSSFQICMEHKRTFDNFIYQAQMTILKGSYGSIIFRSDAATSNFYAVRVGQDGIYSIAMYRERSDFELKHGSSPSFKQGPNQTNLLTVFAQGSHFTFYVNSQYVYDYNDTSFSNGEIGLTSGSIGDPSEVVYSNVKVWAL